MASPIAAYALQIAAYASSHISFSALFTPFNLATLTLTTIQARQTTIHNNRRFGVAFTA